MELDKYSEYKGLDFSEMAAQIAAFWQANDIFKQSISNREGSPLFNFYEGPPSANGKPGIHHVMARTIKDVFCRVKTFEGYQVKRKGGWDAHGLPVELEVEKQLGITKDDIGNKISILEYNAQCRKTVMQYKRQWDELTLKMGYWVDLDNPYITYKKEYIETLWWVLKKLYEKDLLYKGYSIQPYSPAAGTGLSSHELNMPGCYKEVKDVSIVAQFEVIQDVASEFLFTKNAAQHNNIHILAWTTTPWTLPANTALAVGHKIKYLLVDTMNPYTKKPTTIIVAKKAFSRYFYLANEQNSDVGEQHTTGKETIKSKLNHWKIVGEMDGKKLVGIRYQQLMPYSKPRYNAENAFTVIEGDFVTTEEGTGIVHIAPTFGADDFKVAKLNNIPPITVVGEEDEMPIVDRKGKFVKSIGEHLLKGVHKYQINVHQQLYANEFYVKNYTNENESSPNYKSTDVIISIILKEENKAFRVEKYTHSYPHCWRTNKPVLYYPLNAWFIRTTAVKDRMVELNKTIKWKPAATGAGRFGNWLENLEDWNLSRSRYWGTPLPIWKTTDGKEEKCIGSIKELEQEAAKAREKGIKNPAIQYDTFDPHKPYADQIVLISPTGKPMYREPDLIDVWFDSGAMPYAQWHYPFENKEAFTENFPADYIAEGVDQTRGWFFTLHAIAVMLFDSVAFKNVISNGLVLDKEGNKMSKSKGNVIDPFDIIDKHGPDATRWYMIENAPPWENLKFDEGGIIEVKRKLLGTLLNVYSFFALYANIDKFVRKKENRTTKAVPTYLDRWIISCLQSLIAEVITAYDEYEPTRAARAIQQFVNDQLSNWYIRLNRKRFWQPVVGRQNDITDDKKIAYETLYECMLTVSQLMAPITPFFSEWLYKNLTGPTHTNRKQNPTSDIPISVHLTQFPKENQTKIDEEPAVSMAYAQRISSLVHSIRKKNKIKVRTPLNKILLPIIDDKFVARIKNVADVIKNEVNIKSIEYIKDDADIIIKKVKPNYTKLGKQYGVRMKEVVAIIGAFTKEDIVAIEKGILSKGGFDFVADDVLIYSEDVSGWSVASEKKLTVALDITVTEEFKKEGLARDFVNRIQNLRKQMTLDVVDKISIEVETKEKIIAAALSQFKEYICTETQALTLEKKEKISSAVEVDIDSHIVKVKIDVK